MTFGIFLIFRVRLSNQVFLYQMLAKIYNEFLQKQLKAVVVPAAVSK
jgi:hypothetical protein